MSGDGPAPVEAQVLFADCRAPGPISASVGWKVKDVLEAPGSVPVGRSLLQAVDAVGQAYVPDVTVAREDRSAGATPVLKQLRLEGNVMLLAHFADAGLDRTGRASHTMHGLLHSAPLHDATGAYRRPLELFGSPMWLRPIGTDAIEVATVQEARFELPVGPVGLGDVIGDAFLTDLDAPVRVTVLPLVLEAFRSALDGEVTAVLVVADADESARWFALLSNLVDPVSAAALRFSTREDLLSATAVDGWDYHLVAVLRAPSAGGRDPLAVLGSRFLVVDTARPPAERADGSWTLPDGAELRRSPWTELAETVLMSPVVTDGVRHRLDQLGAEVRGLEVEPTWGLPVAALLAGADLPDRDQAVRWVFAHWPANAAPTDELTEELGAVLAHAIGESERLSTELSDSVGPGVPSFLADAVIAGAVRRALADLRPGAVAPALSRRLSPAAASALAQELPGLLAWVDGVAAADRLDTLARVVDFGDTAGLPRAAVCGALRTTVDAVVRRLVDPEFDPWREGWPPIPPDLWRDVFVDPVSDALSVRDSRVEVSKATHEWLTPSLDDHDQPEAAARRRNLQLSGYASRRAAWHGGSPDPWLSAVFAVGMMHVNTFRFEMPPEVAVRNAIARAFGGLPLPVDVAERILDVLEPRETAARLAVAVAALSDGGFTADQVRFARSLQPDVRGTDPLSPDVAPVYLQLFHDRLVGGAPATALDPTNRRAAEYIAHNLGRVGPPELQAAARLMVLGWGLRMPVYGVRGPYGEADQFASVTAALEALVPDSSALDVAAARLLESDRDLTETVAHLIVRSGLALEDREIHVDPFVRYLRRLDDRDEPRLLREQLAPWLARQDKAAPARLAAAVDRVIDDLLTRGWRPRLGELESDRDYYLGALQSRSVLGRRRSRR